MVTPHKACVFVLALRRVFDVPSRRCSARGVTAHKAQWLDMKQFGCGQIANVLFFPPQAVVAGGTLFPDDNAKTGNTMR